MRFNTVKGRVVLGVILYIPVILIRQLSQAPESRYFLIGSVMGTMLVINGILTIIKKKTPVKISKSSEKSVLSYFGINTIIVGIFLIVSGGILIFASLFDLSKFF